MTIKSNYSLIGNKTTVQVVYRVNGIGTIKVEYSLNASAELPNLPKVGVQGGIARRYDTITWYGRGPLENYIDRRTGFDAGIYTLPIDQFDEPM